MLYTSRVFNTETTRFKQNCGDFLKQNDIHTYTWTWIVEAGYVIACRRNTIRSMNTWNACVSCPNLAWGPILWVAVCMWMFADICKCLYWSRCRHKRALLRWSFAALSPDQLVIREYDTMNFTLQPFIRMYFYNYNRINIISGVCYRFRKQNDIFSKRKKIIIIPSESVLL